jgi:hypothetical protein
LIVERFSLGLDLDLRFEAINLITLSLAVKVLVNALFALVSYELVLGQWILGDAVGAVGLREANTCSRVYVWSEFLLLERFELRLFRRLCGLSPKL